MALSVDDGKCIKLNLTIMMGRANSGAANTKRKAEEAPDIENPSKRLKQSPSPSEISKPGDIEKKIRIVPFPEKVLERIKHMTKALLTLSLAWSDRRAQWRYRIQSSQQ